MSRSKYFRFFFRHLQIGTVEQNGQDECMETAEVTERVRELSLLDIEEILSQTQALEAQIQESVAKLEEAVAKANQLCSRL